MTSTRDQIIETTSRLLELQGYFATGLNQIVAESGAPKGSLYHYFPEGKEAITAEAILRSSLVVAERIRSFLATLDHAVEAIPAFIRTMAQYVQASNCRGGAPIATVALETAAVSDRLQAACKSAYDSWQAAFRDKLLASNYPPERAERLALLVITAIEGAIILSRTNRSAAPLLTIADELQLLLDMQHPSAS